MSRAALTAQPRPAITARAWALRQAADAFTSEQVLRAISQTYRPEFQNRLPLTRDLMRVILRKKLGRVLERRGLKDRAWAVEWEASALEFLLGRASAPQGEELITSAPAGAR